MHTFKVTEIIDGDTLAVSPLWRWKGEAGDRVSPTGYDAPEQGTSGAGAATTRLHGLLYRKTIELGKFATIDRGRLVCDVYLNGKNLADFFTRYQT
jgi:endonuclease YncB( thermonuclease family)